MAATVLCIIVAVGSDRRRVRTLGEASPAGEPAHPNRNSDRWMMSRIPRSIQSHADATTPSSFPPSRVRIFRAAACGWRSAAFAAALFGAAAAQAQQINLTAGDILIATDTADIANAAPAGGIWRINPTNLNRTLLKAFDLSVPPGERSLYLHPDGGIYVAMSDAVGPSLYRLNLANSTFSRISGLSFTQASCPCTVTVGYMQLGVSAAITPDVLPLLVDSPCAKCNCADVFPNVNRVFSVNRTNAAMTALSACGGVTLQGIHGMALDSTNNLVVLTTANSDGRWRLVKMDVATGTPGTLTTLFTAPNAAFAFIGSGNDMVVDKSAGTVGDFILYNASLARLSRVDHTNGNETQLGMVGDTLNSGTDLAIEANGNLLLVTVDALVRFDRGSESGGPLLTTDDTGGIRDIAVVPSGCNNVINTNTPTTLEVCEATDGMLSIAATTTGTAFFEWTKNGQKVGGNSNTLTLPMVPFSDNGAIVRCRVMSPCGGLFTNNTALSVIPIPVILSDPVGAPAQCGGNAMFVINAAGPNLSYQWKKGGGNVGTNSATLTLTGVTFADDGAIITCDVSNQCGMDVSTHVLLDVIDAVPAIGAIGDDSIICDMPYVGPTPSLTNTSCVPGGVTWSLLTGPTGMTVNPNTGVVTWQVPVARTMPYNVAVQAVGVTGNGAESWQLTVSNLASNLDCNTNCTLDATDLVHATSADCQTNGTPDECDVISGAAFDCDSNHVPDACQNDADGDGASDQCDGCPNDTNKLVPGNCGCGQPDPGQCPCGMTDVDSDSDGTADCNDQCPNDPTRITPNGCGCGIPDVECFDVSLLGCPPDVTLTASNAQGSALNFGLPLVLGPPANRRAVSADFPSGSIFPVGMTTVTITGRDTLTNRTATCTFKVTILPLPGTGGNGGDNNSNGGGDGDGDDGTGNPCGLLSLFNALGLAAMAIGLAFARGRHRRR